MINPQTYMQAVGFDFVVDELVISYEGMLIQMTHRPRTVRGFSPMTVPLSRMHWVLYGHIHNSTPEHRARHYCQRGDCKNPRLEC